jgi:hypothetical protein
MTKDDLNDDDPNDPLQAEVEHAMVLMAAEQPKRFETLCDLMGVVNYEAFLRNLQEAVKRRMS